jgi:RNA polymerase sigma-70 factor (ECF subfamily)
MSAREAELLLIRQIRQGDATAWNDLIARYEGRLLAFVEVRLRNRAASEDVVQETLLGFLNSLPNYDTSQPLESYLFSIAAHKLTDHLRREGRRPTLPLSSNRSSDSWQPAASARAASSMARSGERHSWESKALIEALRQQIDRMRERGDWTKLKCLELLLVRGWGNKQAATELNISEQQVANFKSDFLQRLKQLVRQQNLPLEIFPELYELPDAK